MSSPVVAALRDPRALGAWSEGQWEMLVRQARSADLLSRIAYLAQEHGVLTQVPTAPRAHLLAAQVVAKAHALAVRREVAQIAEALVSTRVDLILLKGAAYLFADLPASRGRVFADVDILVPREALPQVEAALMLHGWGASHHDAHDQRYYRRWMHELPPMRHIARQTVLDVHHAIVPLKARLKPDSARLLASARELPGHPGLKVLAPADMVLHSAAHLFLNEELSHGLRDLADLDALLRHFGAEPAFWMHLRARADELDLRRPLEHALRYCALILATPAPPMALDDDHAPRWQRRLLDALYLRALQPEHPAAADSLTPLARKLLYLRGHWLRLPPALLAYHLTVKALRRNREDVVPAAR